MLFVRRPSARQLRLAGFALLLAAGSTPAGDVATAAGAQPFPSQVRGVYKVAFNGFDIGSFEFRSVADQRGYALAGDTQISALLGAVRWTGMTRSKGSLAGEAPKPASFTFEFDGTGNTGSVQMSFNGNAVSSVAMTPQRPAEPNVVPLQPQHLKDVLDPLSALIALAKPKSDNPCDRRLAIFDGQQRFDLVLSLRRQQQIGPNAATSQPSTLFVCGVTYVPIAGHKASTETQALARTTGIEVSMRAVQGAGIFVPHQIVVPTVAGSATITVQSLQVTTPANQQIALSY